MHIHKCRYIDICIYIQICKPVDTSVHTCNTTSPFTLALLSKLQSDKIKIMFLVLQID